MRTLLDLLNEIEDKETIKPIEEAPVDMVDEIGKFFVVEKPKSKEDKVDDIVFESTVLYFANQVRGGLDEKTVLGIYKQLFMPIIETYQATNHKPGTKQ